jgi:hypothetical protein
MITWSLPRIAASLAAVTVVLVGTAGCGKSADEAGARRATTAFFAATAAHQDQRACADLVPQAAEGLATSDSGCAEQIGDLKLAGGTIRTVRVWEDRAQVVLSGDTVFLVHLPQGWKIAGAGCRRQSKGPYDCDVEA